MEDEIKTLLHEATPQPSDPEAFRLELNARLAAVEQIKAYRDREYGRSRRTLRIVFSAGILVGVALAALVFLHPFDLPHFTDTPKLVLSVKLFEDTLGYALIALGVLIAASAIVLPLSLSRRHLSRFLSLRND